VSAAVFISSRANAFLKDLKRLAQDSTAYRRQGQVWLEGDHLIRAAVQRGRSLRTLVLAESFAAQAPADWQAGASATVIVADGLWGEFSGLESPARAGALLELPSPAGMTAATPTVVLDRVQDAGNVGSILRSAAAFGFAQVLALKGTAALWSPKVLRAGMGAHFGLHLLEGLEASALSGLCVPLLVTSSHEGSPLQQARLPWPCAWVMGHEGQGVDAGLMAKAMQRVRIPQPGGEESLNVAAAAAICLYASSLQAV
jgi:TrmH family RNA methyltransferase